MKKQSTAREAAHAKTKKRCMPNLIILLEEARREHSSSIHPSDHPSESKKDLIHRDRERQDAAECCSSTQLPHQNTQSKESHSDAEI
jgi:superfamily I DNA and RNA helicase